MGNTAISVENVSKYYKLGQFNSGMFFRDLQSWLNVKRGKEDPNRRIDQDETKSGSGFYALKDVSFQVAQGEKIGIIGKNGAGKSTLLKIISEITTPTNGIIKIRGRVASLLEVGTGFHPEMTGRENIFLNGTILGMKRKEIEKKLDEIIAFSEIEDYIDTPVKRYSSGMYVKLAFAVAANLESEILIADEVLAVGDAAFQKKALGKMNDMSSKEGRTVLFVSHNMSAVRGLCDSGILLEKGKVEFRGDIEEVINRYFENPADGKKRSLEEKINSLPKDRNFTLNELHVRQSGKEISDIVGNANGIDIEMEYTLKYAELGFRVYFDVVSDRGDLLFRSFNDELDGNNLVQPGRYIAKTQIPANILGPKSYIIIVHATVFNVRSCTGSGINIPIKVMQDGLYNLSYPNDTFRGELGISLPWKTEKIG